MCVYSNIHLIFFELSSIRIKFPSNSERDREREEAESEREHENDNVDDKRRNWSRMTTIRTCTSLVWNASHATLGSVSA